MTTQAFSSRVALLTAMALAPWATQAAVVDANPSNYQSLVSALAPGDTLRLAPGTYTHGLSFGGKAGTAAHPITVTGPKDHSAVFTALDCCNTVQLDGTSFLQLKNLTVDAGMAAGVDSRGNSHHITLENLNISGDDANARTVGIAAHDHASDWIIRRDVITGVETGLHFDAPLTGSLIEFNVVVDTAGTNVEVPANSELTTVRYNALRDTMRTSDPEQMYGNVAYANATADVSNANVQASSQGAGTMQFTIAAVSAAAATPTLTMTASPTNVSSGGTSIVSWTTTGIDGCSASGGWTGTKGPNGSETVGPIQSTTSYQLTCLGGGGNAGAMVQVTVGGSTTPPPSNPPPTNPPSDPTPTNPPPTNPPSDPMPTNPPPSNPPSDPTNPTPTNPTPTQPSNPPSVPPPSTGNAMSGGGGSLDGMAIALLVLLAFWRGTRRSVNPS